MRKISLCLAVATAFYACRSTTTSEPTPTGSASYDSTSFTSNVSSKKAITDQFNSLVSKIKTARLATNTLAEADLKAIFTPAFKDFAGVYSSRVETYLTEIASASGKTYNYGIDTLGTGGVYGAYLFDEKGLEYEQLVDKGLFGAMHYRNAALLLKVDLSASDVDQIVHLYGSNPSFPNTNSSTKATNPDRYMAGYAARRSDINNDKSLYNVLKGAFIDLKVAAKAGESSRDKQQVAIATIKLNWEKANAATVINYLYSITNTLEKTAPTDSEISAAMHAHAECIGFLLGWYYVSSGDRVIKDSELVSLLEIHKYRLNAPHSVYRIAKDPFNSSKDLKKAINQLQTIYGFSDADLVGFKENWVQLQAR